MNQHAGTVCVASLDTHVSCLFIYIHSFTSLFIGFYWFICFIVYRPVNPASAKLQTKLSRGVDLDQSIPFPFGPVAEKPSLDFG